MTSKNPEQTAESNKQEQRSKLYQLLGKLPDRHRPISVTHVATEQTNELIVENLLLDLNG